MAERKWVDPAHLKASMIWNHLTGLKKYKIRCGECSHVWKDKVRFAGTDLASSACPQCDTENNWTHSGFEQSFETRWRRKIEA